MSNVKELILPSLISFMVVAALGPIMIPILRKFKFGQTVREEGPQSHMAKNGTPTMGGILIILGIIVAMLFRSKINSQVLVALLSVVGFGMVGFIDDFIIIKKKRNLGLTPKQKIIMQVVLSFIIATYQYNMSPLASNLVIPFTSISIDVGIFYIPLMMFVIIGIVNAVNLTDGLDGLASGVTVVVATFFMVLASQLGNTEIATLASATIGACVGFLIFNSHPAQIFMGDTGSMALGGAVAAFAVLTNNILIVPIVGGIYFAEALSVILQVVVFKKTGKRIFKMAPLHHHYEQCGWAETKVVFVFWIVSMVLAWVSVMAIF